MRKHRGSFRAVQKGASETNHTNLFRPLALCLESEIAIQTREIMENILEDVILTEKECALLLHLHVKTLQRARKRGEPIVPYAKAGRQIRYSKMSVIKFMQKTVEIETGAKQPDSPVEAIAMSPSLSETRRRGRPRKKHVPN